MLYKSKAAFKLVEYRKSYIFLEDIGFILTIIFFIDLFIYGHWKMHRYRLDVINL